MKKLKNYLILIGFVILLAGLAYDAFFAGIPYQDAPAELTLKYDRNKTIAVVIMLTGLSAVSLGILVQIIMMVLELTRRVKRR